VLIAPDRAKALALLSTAHPDLIVMDVNGETLALLDAIPTRL
jgi:CheY-like chemotaxis protein